MIKEIFIQENRPHESGAKHVSGYAHYTDDISEPEGTLYGAIGWAKKSHAIIKAKEVLERDFRPISDMRASGKYRMMVAKNLLHKCFLEIAQKKLIRVNN